MSTANSVLFLWMLHTNYPLLFPASISRAEGVMTGPVEVCGHKAPHGVHSGVKLGEFIVGVEGQDIQLKSITEISALIRGEPGTHVSILLRDSSCVQVSFSLCCVYTFSLCLCPLEIDTRSTQNRVKKAKHHHNPCRAAPALLWQALPVSFPNHGSH